MNRSELSQSEREKAFENQLSSKKNGTYHNNKSKEYMANPQVKEFNMELRKKVFNSTGVGRPYKWDSVEEVEKDIIKFFELCDRTNTIPTVINLSVWLGCNKDTIYEHANNSSSPFSVLFKNVLNMFHGTLENSSISGAVNPVLYMFLSKNYFGLRDDKNIQVSATNTQGSPNAEETASALRKQLENETTVEATFSEQ